MPYASIAIVGRPNVGKSTLFNRLVGSRIAIEAPTAGVTRDRVLYPLTIEDRTFDLIDTGGIGIVDKQNLSSDVENQITLAINEASVLLFLVDCRDGITPLDEHVAERLRKTGKPVLLVANKADTFRLEENMPSFHALGFGEVIAVSAKENRNIDDLEDAILEILPPAEEDEEPVALRELLKVAFVGRRNVGKSSMINCLSGAERVIVSDTPGTTRDSVDIIIERDGQKFVAIDTAGMRKHGQMDDVMEFYGHLRTERAIRRADVVILMLDAMEEIGKVDKQLGALILEHHKPCIIALNKWDLAVEKNPGITVDAFQKYVADKLPGLHFCKLAGLSAKEGTNTWQLVQAARQLGELAKMEVKTAQINNTVAEAYRKRRPRPQSGKIAKIYYGTQVGVQPPTFLLFCSNPQLIDDNYRRFLSSQFREMLGYAEVPVRLILRASGEKEIGRYAE